MLKKLRKYAAPLIAVLLVLAAGGAIAVYQVNRSADVTRAHELLDTADEQEIAALAQRRQLLATYGQHCPHALVAPSAPTLELKRGCGVTEENVDTYNTQAADYNNTIATAQALLYNPLTAESDVYASSLTNLQLVELVQ